MDLSCLGLFCTPFLAGSSVECWDWSLEGTALDEGVSFAKFARARADLKGSQVAFASDGAMYS